MTAELMYAYMDSPLGEIELCANDLALVSALFVKTEKSEIKKKAGGNNKILLEGRTQLERYFNGEIRDFKIPLFMKGTDFQNQVWDELRKIPFAKTISYLQLAKNLGDEKSIRAAASANGRNPFAIIVPCHRVIGSNGSLTGYAGDLWRKEWLLDHEAKLTGAYAKLF